ncbi:hypothetical protein BOX15_Mlig027962g1 [Macrostomum lignano]|uniref:EF-hand domain-containing protein n=1 Tax=Macrostomum lignano TaxID=282301 RepID=A0A267E9Q6_9PLAT|nr:hypothetical protein BOX15_Mlig027962g1 [Macrostomum lignano]
MSAALGKLRGAVTKIMTETGLPADGEGGGDGAEGGRSQLEVPRRVNIWTELARGMKKVNTEEADQPNAPAESGLERLQVVGGPSGPRERRGSKMRIKSLVSHLDSVLNKPLTATELEGGMRVEEFLQLQHLKQVKYQFETHQPTARSPERDSQSRAQQQQQQRPRKAGMLNVEEFKNVLCRVIGHDRFADQLERLFHRLDTDSQGVVSWQEFCNYMMLYLSESDRLSVRVEPPFKSEPRLRHVMYNRQEPTARLLLTETPTRPISVSKTGCILLWDCLLKLEAHLETQGGHTDLAATGKRLFNEWVMDAAFMENCKKLVLSTTGREVKFYDIASNVIKEEFVLYGMRSVATALKFHYQKEAANKDCQLFMGDDQGSLTILVFKRPMQQLFDIPPDPNHRSQRVWYHELASAHTRCVEVQVHEGLHSEGINDLVYLPDAGCTVSCSSSPNNSVVIYKLSQKRAVYTFRLRRGVECFDIARGINLLVTGSPDHLVRFWNPYVPSKPTALMEGHNNSVLSVRIHERHGYIVSYARDGAIKVWDIRAQRCVQTVIVRIPYAVSDKMPEHMACPLTLHVPSNTVYLTSNDNIVQYRLGKAADPVPGLVQTHRTQLCAAIYNPLFRQVTTASDDSCVTTWDLETGNKCLVFANAHGEEEITCLAYDHTWRRLFTGSRHGCLKVWNFQTGQQLHDLAKTADAEITGMCVVPSQQRILTVGWSRAIVCYKDSNPEDLVRPAVEWRGGVQHEDDILTSDFCPPDLFATASYDGAILVWHVELEKLLVRLREGFHERIEKKIYRAQGLTPPPSRCSTATGNSRPNSRHRLSRPDRGAAERSPTPAVDKLLFLKQRASEKRHRDSGFLVTSEAGFVRFWSVHGRRHEMAAFQAAAEPDECVLAMATNRRNTALLTGDTCGYVRNWTIGGYALFQKDKLETIAPPCLTEFRAHDVAIVSVDFAEVERGDFIVTASVDCTAKLFSANGDVIGTFGQPKPWDINNRKTWKQAQIDRQKFFDEVDALPDEAGEKGKPSSARKSFPVQPMIVETDESGDQLPDATMKVRSQTMPVVSASDNEGHKPQIGLKAELDFERIRMSRSGRRHEFGGVEAQATMPMGVACTPYTALKTTEFKSFSLSANLPQPSWSAGRSKTAVGFARAAEPAVRSPGGIGRDLQKSAGERPERSVGRGKLQVRLPPIPDAP